VTLRSVVVHLFAILCEILFMIVVFAHDTANQAKPDLHQATHPSVAVRFFAFFAISV
jgi:hypothetical protein